MKVDVNIIAQWKHIDDFRTMWVSIPGLISEPVKNNRIITSVLNYRDNPLVITRSEFPENGIVLTVEEYIKWYHLFLFKIEKYEIKYVGGLGFDDIDRALPDFQKENQSYVQGNHCVNPWAVIEFCKDNDIVLPTVVDYMIKGMWWECTNA